MKKGTRFTSALLTLLLLFSLVLPAQAATIEEWTADWKTHTADAGKIALTPGENHNDMNFAWVSFAREKAPGFQYSQSPDLAQAAQAEISERRSGMFYHSYTVSLKGLAEGTWYYSFTSGGAWTQIHSFRITDPKDGFQVMFTADAQIGRSGESTLDEVLQRDSLGWNTTLEATMRVAPDTSFILHAGDQVEDFYSKKQYNLFLAPTLTKSLPIATAIGNHDFVTALYDLHFNNPNQVKETYTTAGNPYYFERGGVLFIVANGNNLIAGDHDNLMYEAVKAYPDAKWRVMMIHQGPYYPDMVDENAVKSFVPLYDKYSIDLVLCGHLHKYSRTYPLKGNAVAADGKGTVYLAAGSASGSNMRHFETTTEFVEAAYDFDVPSFSILEFKGGALGIKTYRNDTLEVVDECVITKDVSEAAPVPQEGASPLFNIISKIIRTVLDFVDGYIHKIYDLK